MQGSQAGVQGITALQHALRSHGLSAYASILKAFLQAGAVCADRAYQGCCTAIQLEPILLHLARA